MKIKVRNVQHVEQSNHWNTMMRERHYVKNVLNTNNGIYIYRENHREELRPKAKEHYEQYKGQKLEKQKEQVECPICKFGIQK